MTGTKITLENQVAIGVNQELMASSTGDVGASDASSSMSMSIKCSAMRHRDQAIDLPIFGQLQNCYLHHTDPVARDIGLTAGFG
ncbi:hypothetical protein GCM10009713_00460 [Brevibacterium celere]